MENNKHYVCTLGESLTWFITPYTVSNHVRGKRKTKGCDLRCGHHFNKKHFHKFIVGLSLAYLTQKVKKKNQLHYSI
jgi:hypothetical protein